MKAVGLVGPGGKFLLYYMLGSDPALWPAGERRERELITHDKDIIIHIVGANVPKGTFRPYWTP